LAVVVGSTGVESPVQGHALVEGITRTTFAAVSKLFPSKLGSMDLGM
jgi:hypothetical protein